jgi:VIT1/CCC1 family predicted Fe2+/Mn2+ transporter
MAAVRADERRSDRIREAVLSGHPFGPGRLRERWHLGGRSGSLRAAIFGLSDGLVSNLALILGVAGSGAESNTIVIAGIAGLLAGALSMGAGEYLSMRVQREVFEHALEVESMEIDLLPDDELRELTDIFAAKGVPRPLASEAAASLMETPERALDIHAREELGLDPDELGAPWGAAFSSFATFSAGAIVPLMPYLLSRGDVAFVLALAAGGSSLAVVGGFMAHLTSRSIARGAVRMLAIGLTAAGVTFVIGKLFGVALA